MWIREVLTMGEIYLFLYVSTNFHIFFIVIRYICFIRYHLFRIFGINFYNLMFQILQKQYGPKKYVLKLYLIFKKKTKKMQGFLITRFMYFTMELIFILYFQTLQKQKMGNSTISKHASNYQKHKKLGQINLSIVVDQDQNNYQQMTIIRSLQSQNQFNLWYKELKKIDDTITRQVLLIPNKTVYESTGFCGSNGIVHLSYDYYPYVFQVEVDNRRNIGRYFLETELWYLLYNMARAGSKFEKYHKKIGDVHPSNILINDDGLIKLISTCSMPDEISNFDKLMQNPAAKVFLAPEELDQHSVQRAEYPKNIDPSLAECYSIGLCMLAAGTLQDIDSIYYFDQAEKKIQQHKISYYLKLFGEKYSSHLHSIVMGLLMDNPLQRKKCGEIYSSLYEHQDKILDLQTFFPYNSRIIPLSSQINNSAQNVQVYPVMSKDNRPLYQENQYHHPNTYTPQSNKIYSYPNGIMVNPIQSKYVPINMVQNQQMVGHQSMPNRVMDQIPGNVYRQSGNVLFSGKRQR